MDRSSIHELVEARALRSPDAIALIDGDRRMTYRELDASANQLAHSLRARGATRETLVGVRWEPSLEQVVAVLATLKAGAAYLPLDPDDPRSDEIIADAAPVIVVSQVDLSTAPTPKLDGGVAPDDAMYVLYTSGSTGVPKGVVGVHAAISNRLHWQQQVYPYGVGEVACARTPLTFVDSVAELFAPLAFGVPLVIIDREGRRDLTRMIDTLAAHRVTRIVLVPSLLATLFELAPDLGTRVPALRWWFVGGEPAPPALVERFFRQLPGRKLINIYGSTEVSGDATYFDFDRMPAGLTTSPIGIPLSGVHVRILDEELRETDVGEVCVSGVCLARGYLRRAELTAQRFIANPFPEGGLLYRMGDLGRCLPSGDLQYLGRTDQLVKIRGMRVELGEVEARMLAAPGIAQAVAIAREDHDGGRTLVGFYTGAAEPAAVRVHLVACVPSYMVPTHLVALAALPLNPSRKIDRRALAGWPIAVATGELALTDDERRIARIWEDILERTPIGRAQSFYDLGGTSLSAVRIIARLRDELALAIPLGAIFEHPTVAQLAAHLRELAPAPRRAQIAPTTRPPPASAPLSHHQYPFWFFRMFTGDVSVVSDAFGFTSPVAVYRLQRAFANTVAAFDTLWMRYPRWRSVQQLAPRAPFTLEVRDRRDGRDDASVLAEEAADNNTRRFALTKPPHVHARLIWLPSRDHRLLVAIPHIAIDMAAFELFRARLEHEYCGTAAPPTSGASLYDLVEHERGEPVGLEADRRYWHALTAGDAWNQVPARFQTMGRGARALARLPVPSLAALAEYARAHASSVPIAMIGAISAGLREAFERDDLTLLLMIDKRDRPELRELFTTMTALMPLRVRDTSMTAIGHQLLTSYAHSDHLMRVPTLWNDSWARAPRSLRHLFERANPLLARYLFALVPSPRKGRAIMILVNILPEVYLPEAAAIVRLRTIDLILRPGDFIVGSDVLLDRTLQIHVTREAGQLVLNLYGGGIDQQGLDEIGAHIVTAVRALA